jgi:hypothetical protein
VQGTFLRALRCVRRLRDPNDAEFTDEMVGLADELDGLMAATTTHAGARRLSSWEVADTFMAGILFLALRALSLVPVPEAERVTVDELAFEGCAAQWALGHWPTMVCLRCGHEYHVTGRLGCPPCHEAAT